MRFFAALAMTERPVAPGAGEQQVIERQRREGRASSAAVLEERQLFRREVIRRDAHQHLREALRIFDIFTMARLPAAMIAASGVKERLSGSSTAR